MSAINPPGGLLCAFATSGHFGILDNVTGSPIGKWDCNSDLLEMVEVSPLLHSFLKNFGFIHFSFSDVPFFVFQAATGVGQIVVDDSLLLFFIPLISNCSR